MPITEAFSESLQTHPLYTWTVLGVVVLKSLAIVLPDRLSPVDLRLRCLARRLLCSLGRQRRRAFDPIVTSDIGRGRGEGHAGARSLDRAHDHRQQFGLDGHELVHVLGRDIRPCLHVDGGSAELGETHARQIIDAVESESPVEYQSYRDAYDKDFEDVRRRVPDISRLIEAIDHARAAEVPIVVALNKCDLPGVDVNNAMSQLSANDLLPSEWGGDVDEQERTIASILQNVWFASFVGWAGGLHDVPQVLADTDKATQLLLAA